MFVSATSLLWASCLLSAVSANVQCKDQSCKIADVSGSTGKTPGIVNAYRGHLKSQKPSGVKCIENWWISGFNLNSKRRRSMNMAEDANMQLAAYHKLAAEVDASVDDITVNRAVSEALVGLKSERLGGCKPNILLYARGTVETGALGEFVGPSLVRNLKSMMGDAAWDVRGVPYHSNFAGDYCAGIPGGKYAIRMLNQIVQECPQSKIVVSGYSQGAMVVRIGVAFGVPAVKQNTVGVVVFGDPFNGAVIAGYNSGNIKTFCHTMDGVCGGALRITPSHLTYGGDAKDAAKWIQAKVRSTGIGPQNLGPGKIFDLQAAGGAAAVKKQLGIN